MTYNIHKLKSIDVKIKDNFILTLKENKVPPVLFDSIIKNVDLEGNINKFYGIIISKIKAKSPSWQQNTEITKKRAKLLLRDYSISKRSQNAMLKDMEQRGLICMESRGRGSKVRIL